MQSPIPLAAKRRFHDGVEYDRYPLAAVVELMKLLHHVEGAIGRIEIPTLILHARGDRRVSVTNADRIFQAVGSRIKERILLDDPTHMVMLGEDRIRVEREVCRFVDRHSK